MPDAPAPLDVNLYPLGNNGDFWQTPEPAGFVKIDTPQVYWFRVGPDYVTILWRAGWNRSEYNAPRGTITWPQCPAGVTPAVQDLVSGEVLVVGVSRQDALLTVADLPVGGAPIAIRWLGAV
jgi:hypothetical protein